MPGSRDDVHIRGVTRLEGSASDSSLGDAMRCDVDAAVEVNETLAFVRGERRY